MMRLKEFFQDQQKREIALVIFTGLVVAWVRHGLQHHWKVWDSWENFFLSWFVHTMGVILLMGISLVAIFFSHRFFLGDEYKGQQPRELTFYIVMTILVAALGIAIVANAPPSDDDYDDSSTSLIFFG